MYSLFITRKKSQFSIYLEWQLVFLHIYVLYIYVYMQPPRAICRQMKCMLAASARASQQAVIAAAWIKQNCLGNYVLQQYLCYCDECKLALVKLYRQYFLLQHPSLDWFTIQTQNKPDYFLTYVYFASKQRQS